MNMHGQSVRSVWRSLEFKIRDRSDDVFHAAERFSNIFSDPTFRIYPFTTTIRLSRWPNEGSLANRFDLPGWRNPWTRSRRYGLLRLVLTTSERVEAEEMNPKGPPLSCGGGFRAVAASHFRRALSQCRVH